MAHLRVQVLHTYLSTFCKVSPEQQQQEQAQKQQQQ